jgi:hypothetical protein
MAAPKDLSGNAEVMAAVRKYGIDPKGAEPNSGVTAPPIEPDYEAPEIDLATQGLRSFKDIFGWKPKIASEIPVRIFADEDWHEAIRPLIPPPCQ